MEAAASNLWAWVSPVLSFIAVVAVAVIGARAGQKTTILAQTTPAYQELLTSERETREGLAKLNKDLDEERRQRRRLEDRVGTLESDRESDREWIRRTIARVWRYDRSARPLLRPFPEWFDPVENGADSTRQPRED